MKGKSDNIHQIWYRSKHLEMFRAIGEKVGKHCIECAFLEGCYDCRVAALGQGGYFFDGDGERPYTSFANE